MATKSLTFDIFGRDRSASKTITGVGKSVDRLRGQFQSLSRGLAIGVGAGIAAAGVALGKVLADSFEAIKRIEVINAQTESVLKSTGGAANVSAIQVETLADRLEKLTATEAEQIQEGANLLLTFKNIRNEAGKGNDVFDQTVAVATDMARAMGTDVKSGAIQLGKALNDPIRGISALTRVGVTFDDRQRDLIKTLVETGDVMGAQKVILQELNSEFGGSGAAYADTFSGKIDLLGHRFGEMGEKVALALMPAIEDLIDFIQSDVAPELEGFASWFSSEGVPALEGFVGFLRDNKDDLADWATGIGLLTVAVWGLNAAMLANPVGAFVAGLALIAGGVIYLTQVNKEAGVQWMRTVEGFVQVGLTAVQTLAGVGEGFVNMIIDALNGAAQAAKPFLDLFGIPVGQLGKVDFTSGFRNLSSAYHNAIYSVDAHGNRAAPQVGFNANDYARLYGAAPRLAEGGIVSRRPGGIFANIGEGRWDEAVVPLSPANMRAMGGGDTYYISVPGGYIGDENRLVQKLATAVANVKRRGGVSAGAFG